MKAENSQDWLLIGTEQEPYFLMNLPCGSVTE